MSTTCWTLQFTGQYAEAEPLFLRVSQPMSVHLVKHPSHSLVSTWPPYTTSHSADTLSKELLYLRGLKPRKRRLREHPHTLTSVTNLPPLRISREVEPLISERLKPENVLGERIHTRTQYPQPRLQLCFNRNTQAIVRATSKLDKKTD